MKTDIEPQGMTTRTVYVFFALTFALTWSIGTILVLFADQVERIFGPLSMTNPVFILAVYAPGFVGTFLVWRHYGVRGLGQYLRRLTLWRMSAPWWLLLAIGVPALFFLGAAIKGSLTDPFPFSPWYGVFAALAIALFLGPIEEFGWRGVALPLLQRRMAPLWAALLLGAVWGIWHAPAFLLSGTPQSAWSFGPYLVAVIALSVIVTGMFNASRGSLLIPVLFHFQANGPIWPDAQPWDTLTFAAAAVVVTVVNWRSMTGRDAGVTAVLLEDSGVTEEAGSRTTR
jgi:membrane protease YdiL (CAAX protease family)